MLDSERRVETEFYSDIDYKTLLRNFKKILKSSGLKFTSQRELILKELYSADKHMTSEELHLLLNQKYPNIKIGIATVYRTLSLLESENFVTHLTPLESDTKRYELSIKAHHDHIICQECGKIVEFVDEEIEALQLKVAESLGFKLLNHSMQIYGVCRECQNRSRE